MSLRARLVLTVMTMVTLGLFVMVGAIFGALQDLRGDRTDDVLAAVAREADRATGETDARLLEHLVPGEGAGPVWRRLAEAGDLPSFYQLRDAEGRVLDTVAFGPRPDLGDELPGELRPADGPDGVRLAERGSHWRLMATRVDGRDTVLVLGMRTDVADEFSARVRNTALITGAAVLLGLGLLSLRTVRVALRPLDEIATTAAAIGAGDLSSRVATADARTEVGRLGRALNAMLGQIEAAFAARRRSEDRLRRFVADASHELRTPIATVRGYAELFRRGASSRPDDLADVLLRIESEATRMGHLVDELLLLARLDQGRPLSSEPVDLVALVDRAVADAGAVDADRQITVETDGAVLVNGDPERLRQVLDNLLANVRLHTPPGTPAIVRVVTERAAAVVEVSDAGPGIPADLRERVFERFFRGADAVRSASDGGSGLGLSIVVAVVEAHGGRVSAETASAGGARIRIELPRSP
ncbi:sensor histidine kinase [Cryptosporangium aurantiacum]|uniref:histidine kinase n=1 Tax=Cryptosporangium aurantiacum TaxID=134849 RepID=A0A1M7PBT2_9ACTN|nr:HAMP domain-containing sensor histidine kinase [Cryptosporangium aurantiacum]SHN13802.1 two-component system, OmpR family, sensor kinase [Cryptosporangium aurantiacum]